MVVLAGLSVDWLIFIIVLSSVVFILLALLIGIPLYKKHIHKNFQEYYYKKINRVVLDNDYYLINNFSFKTENSKMEKINHLIFAEKYIYLVFDYYYEGDLTGKIEDKSLIYYSFKRKDRGRKCYTENPYFAIEKIIKSLTYKTGISRSMFIGIALINDECNLAIESNTNSFYIIQRKRLPALIKAIESRPVNKMNEEQLARVVKDIARLNRKKRK